jgi:single-stranded-DNA-specific exonuclease
MKEFAADLHSYNSERKTIEESIFSEAVAMIEHDPIFQQRKSTVLWNQDWSKGVIGIVASRLIERVYRPTIMLTESNGKWVGSSRSVEGFDLYAALDACSEHLVQFGGHKYAAGLTLDEACLEPFREAFENYVSANITEEQMQPILDIAGDLPLREIDLRIIKHINKFGPFGPGNQEPVFMARNVALKDLRILKNLHLKLSLAQDGVTYDAIGFNLAYRWLEVNSTELDIAYQPEIQVYRGQTRVQLKLKDIRKAIS